jgi:hypothetical protein
VPIFEALQQNSPPSIEPQVASIIGSLKQEQEENADPLGALVTDFVPSIEASGSWQQVSNNAPLIAERPPRPNTAELTAGVPCGRNPRDPRSRSPRAQP